MTTSESLAEIITRYASEIEEGVIVELGSYHGKGTIALAKEAKVPVYSIDDFVEKYGWIGERYGPEDEEIYWQNIEVAGVKDKVIQLKMSLEEAAKKWEWRIGLLYWDPGIPGRFRNDFADWGYFVVPNGLFIAKDAQDGQLGTFPIVEEIIKHGWERFEFRGAVSFLRKLE